MSTHMRYDYYHNLPPVSYIGDWAPPQPEQRRCGCGTILRRTNPDDSCEVCKRKYGKERK